MRVTELLEDEVEKLKESLLTKDRQHAWHISIKNREIKNLEIENKKLNKLTTDMLLLIVDYGIELSKEMRENLKDRE